MTKAVEITPTQAYRQAFDDRLDSRKGEPEALLQLREQGLARFEEHGFPHAKLEQWKKTNIKRIAATRYDLAAAPDKKTIESVRRAVDHLRIPEAMAHLVFVDGFHVPELSSVDKQDGLDVGSLAKAIRDEQVEVGDLQPGQEDSNESVGTGPEWALAQLNLALFTDGLFLRVAPGVQLEHPVHMIHLTTPGADPFLVVPRHRVELAENAHAGLVETYGGLGDGGVWTNTVLEAQLAQGARLQHYKVQRQGVRTDHIGLSAVRVGKDATLEDLSFSLGAGLSRHDIHVALTGQGAHADLNGVFLGRFEQHVDHRTTIIHAVPNTTSREFYKGVMDDSGHGVFTGKIVVAKGAQHTDADQQNRNLILSRKGLVDSTPQLEIFADDVKCAHGSTIGQIDPDQLFYMQSRGIPRQRARMVLTQAFAHEPLELVPEGPMRQRMADLVTKWFVAGNPEALKDSPSQVDPEAIDDPLLLPGAPSRKGKNDKDSKVTPV